MDAPTDVALIRRAVVEHAMPSRLLEVFSEFHRRGIDYCY